MEDDLKKKWKTTSKNKKWKTTLKKNKKTKKTRRPKIIKKIEDDLKKNGIQTNQPKTT